MEKEWVLEVKTGRKGFSQYLLQWNGIWECDREVAEEEYQKMVEDFKKTAYGIPDDFNGEELYWCFSADDQVLPEVTRRLICAETQGHAMRFVAYPINAYEIDGKLYITQEDYENGLL